MADIYLMHRFIVLIAVVFQLGSVFAWATDVPITGLKLIVVDKLQSASKAKAVFVAKDMAISKGTGTDPAHIGATLDVAYDSATGTFLMPQGSNWIVNSDSVGKYVNKSAPTGGAVKVSVIKPGLLVKVVGKSLGDTPLDLSNAPSGTVYVAATVVNGAETTRLCTQLTGCVHKSIAKDTGYKLVCKGNSVGDPACTAATDGCEADTMTDVLNCGACGNVCASLPNAAAACVGAVCTLGPCDAGYDDCDGNTDNGCEIDLPTDPSNCGACGTACPILTPNCSGAICVP